MSSVPADLQRFLFLVPWLAQRPDGVPLGEVCARLDVTDAALHKLIERVAFVGTPDGTPDELVDLYVEGDRLFVALPQHFVRAPRFSPEEMLALLVVLAPLRDAPVPRLAEEAGTLMDRLRALASDRAEALARAVDDRVRAEGEGLEAPETLATLERAVRERRVCEIDYYTASRDTLSTRQLRPLALIERRGAWYAIGDDEKTFKVERVKRVAILDERFEPPEGVDLTPYRRGELFAWERVSEAEAATEAAPGGDAIEGWATFREGDAIRRWPTWRGGRARNPSLRAWVRGRRGDVAWLEPTEERDAFLDETRALLARYRPDSMTEDS